METNWLSLLLVLTGLSPTKAGQFCSSCSNVQPTDVCQHHIECRNDEKCYVHQYTTESGLDLSDFGCTAAQACPHPLESVFGKRHESTMFGTHDGQSDEGRHFKCMACCNDTAICNQKMTCVGTTNPGLTTTTNPGLTTTTNPGLTATTNPGLTATTNPGLTASTNPGLTATTNPGLTATTNPGLTATTYPGLTGTTNPGLTLPKDCSELVIPNHQSGSYTIYPYGVPHLPVSVYCEFEGNEAWTVIQRRFNGSVNFYRNWDAYKNGFGASNGEYWLGNDVIHQLTASENYKLRIVLTDWSNVTKYAEYSMFRIADESHKYSLSIWGYSGTAGDAMDYHDGMQFSTYDNDNDRYPGNCANASFAQSGWWFNICRFTDLNAYYYTSSATGDRHKGITWSMWHDYGYSLKATKMMIRK